jgi:cytochrome c-type biogenesis protein CcmH
MTVFAITAALLLIGALFFILPTLLRTQGGLSQNALSDEVNLAVLRDQLRELDADLAAGVIDAAGYRSAKQELERRVLEDVKPGAVAVTGRTSGAMTAGLIGLAVPLLAVSLYLVLGSPAGLDPAKVAAAPNDQTHAVTEDQIVEMIAALSKRLQDSPNDAEGWHMLARSNSALGRFGEAATAYSQLVKLVPGNAELLADYADTLAMSLNRSLLGEPEEIINLALSADSNNVKALALSGSAAFERRDYQRAVTQWTKILPLAPPESEIGRSIVSSINEAQKLAGLPVTMPQVTLAVGQSAPAAATPSTTTTTNETASAEVAGTVELDAALRSKVSDTDTVFIYARAAEGPRFPLAVLRKQVKDLPTTFVLDDSMSMVPDAKLSNFPMVVVGARISKSGSATPSAGDLEGVTEPVRPGAKGLQIRINSQRS